MKYAVGIDVGGTNTRVALINEKYEIKERVQFGSDPKNPIKTLNQINDVIKGFGEKIEGIGISCPGLKSSSSLPSPSKSSPYR